MHPAVNEGRGPGLEVVPASAPGASEATTLFPSRGRHYGPTYAVRLVVVRAARPVSNRPRDEVWVAARLLHTRLDLSGPLRSLPTFCLQNSHFLGWTRRDSNS